MEASGSNAKEVKKRVKVDKQGRKLREDWLNGILSTSHTPTAAEKRDIHRQIQATNTSYSYETFQSWYHTTRNARQARTTTSLPDAASTLIPPAEDSFDTSFLSIPLDNLKEMANLVGSFSSDPEMAEAPINSLANLFDLDVSVVRSLHAYMHWFGWEKIKDLATNAHANSGPQTASSSSLADERALAHLPTPAPSEPPPDGPSPQVSPLEVGHGDFKNPNILDGLPPLQHTSPPSPVSPSHSCLPPALPTADDSNHPSQVVEQDQDQDKHINHDHSPMEEDPPTDLQGFLSQLSKYEGWMDDLLQSVNF